MSGTELFAIRGAELYDPAPVGRQDVLVGAGKVLRIGDLSAWLELDGVVEIDAEGLLLLPGLIDQHVHILGGGGGAGFGSRGPELTFSEVIGAGVTTVVGCLGIDTVGRGPVELVAKARSLRARGLSAYAYVGGFDVPPRTVFGDVRRDIFLINEVIGVGEPAVSDFRSLHPTPLDLARLFSTTLIGGRQAGKAGVTHIHLGGGREGLQPVLDAVDLGEIPVQYVLPTHFNRTALLMEHAREWARRGGWVDLTSAMQPQWFSGALPVADAVVSLVSAGVPLERMTVSSDGNGVHTLHGAANITRFPMALLTEDLRALVHRKGMPLTDVLPLFTSNVAKAIAMPDKGVVHEGADADLLLVDRESLHIRTVFVGGRIRHADGQVVDPQLLDV